MVLFQVFVVSSNSRRAEKGCKSKSDNNLENYNEWYK